MVRWVSWVQQKNQFCFLIQFIILCLFIGGIEYTNIESHQCNWFLLFWCGGGMCPSSNLPWCSILRLFIPCVFFGVINLLLSMKLSFIDFYRAGLVYRNLLNVVFIMECFHFPLSHVIESFAWYNSLGSFCCLLEFVEYLYRPFCFLESPLKSQGLFQWACLICDLVFNSM